MRTALEYFDWLVWVSAHGGFPSIGHVQTCRLRGVGGRRCPLGWLIPDGVYRPELEGLAAEYPGYNETIADGLQAELCDILIENMPSGLALQDLQEISRLHAAMLSFDYRGRAVWPHAEFVRRLSELPCFKKVLEAPCAM